MMSLGQLISILNPEDMIYVGAKSAWLFIGKVKDFAEDCERLNKVYSHKRFYDENGDLIPFEDFMTRSVKDVYPRDDDVNHSETCIVVEGRETGQWWSIEEAQGRTPVLRNSLRNRSRGVKGDHK